MSRRAAASRFEARRGARDRNGSLDGRTLGRFGARLSGLVARASTLSLYIADSETRAQTIEFVVRRLRVSSNDTF